MRHSYHLLLLFSTVVFTTYAQTERPPLLNIGDAAPPLRVNEWIKGTPVKSFEKGQVYVIEFWATWCKPCRAAMPHLSALANQYKDKVTIVGIDIYENSITSIKQIKTFVDSMGHRMDYSVATGDSNFTVADWIENTGNKNRGIPTTFVVDKEGLLAWIGHPCDLEDVLFKIVNNTWDIDAALFKRKQKFLLRDLEISLGDTLDFAPNGDVRTDSWEKDSALLRANEVAKIDSLIKLTPRIAYRLFSILVEKDVKEAYEFGEKVIKTETYDEPAAYSIREAIVSLSEKIKLTPEIYQLGIDAILVEIDEALSCLPEIKNEHRKYNRLAEWYYHTGNKPKAIEAQQKAIEELKKEKNYAAKDLAAYESYLKIYKKI